MTALAVALVLCCAMVCGTYLLYLCHEERRTTRTLGAVDVEAVNRKVHLVDEAVGAHHRELSAIRSELESLRASVALRSV